MLRTTLILCLFATFSLSAETTFSPEYSEVDIFQFVTKDELKMTPFRYRAYIRPQLRSIRSEYYQLLRRVRPGHDYLIDLKTQTEKIETGWRDFRESCPEVTEGCLPGIKALHREVQSLDIQLLEIQALSFESFSNLDDIELEDIFRVMENINHMAAHTYRMKNTLEYLEMLTETPYLREAQSKKSFEEDVMRIRTYSEVLVTSLIPNRHSLMFNLLWRNFIRPIDREILGKDSPEYLMIYLERLNYSFHEFHMRLSKGRHQLSENDLQLVSTIHRRWNTILRVLVRDIGF